MNNAFSGGPQFVGSYRGIVHLATCEFCPECGRPFDSFVEAISRNFRPCRECRPERTLIEE